MIKIDIIAPGLMKQGPMLELVQNYKGMMRWPVTIHELKDEKKIAEKIKKGAYIIALDERGKTLGSIEFANLLQKQIDEGQKDIQFIIGPADGLTDNLRNSADKLISFGKQTWPHMLVRVMLLEQLYRAQQILKGHPYHRE